MTASALDLAPDPDVAAASPVDHVVCCRDDNLALCGTDVTDEPWADPVDLCVVCDALAAEVARCSPTGPCLASAPTERPA
jgi:hypothetical protein